VRQSPHSARLCRREHSLLSMFHALLHFLRWLTLRICSCLSPLLTDAGERRRIVQLQEAMARARAALAKGDEEEAATLAEAVMREGRSAEAVLVAARAHILAGRSDRAARLALEVMREDRANAEALAVRGEALAAGGDLPGALTHVKEALRRNPDEASAKATLRVRDLPLHPILQLLGNSRPFLYLFEATALAEWVVDDRNGTQRLPEFSLCRDSARQATRWRLRTQRPKLGTSSV